MTNSNSKVRELGLSISKEAKDSEDSKNSKESKEPLPEHLAILELKGKVFTYSECVKNGYSRAFKRYYDRGLIVEYKKVLKQRMKVRGVGIGKLKKKYGIPKEIEIYTFVRDHESKEWKELEELWRKRIAWIQIVDNVNCDRVDRVVEDSQRAAERRKTKSIDRQIRGEEEWMRTPKKVIRAKEPFVCSECGGTTYKVRNGQQACTSCGTGWHLQTPGPGPLAIRKPKRKFRRVEYRNGKTLVLDKEGKLVQPETKGWTLDIKDNQGWLSGKGAM